MRDAIKNLLQYFLTKKYQLSLAVLIPAFLALFVIGPMYIAIDSVEKLVPRAGAAGVVSAEDLRGALGLLRLVMWVSFIAALASGFALVYSILKPLKKFMQNPVSTSPDADEGISGDEFGILGRDFITMMSSLGRHVSILQGMSGGVMAFDRDGRVTAVNPFAERILGRAAEVLLNMRLADVCRSAVQSADMERVILDGLRHQKAYSSEEVRITLAAGREMTAALTTSILRGADGKTSGIIANFMDLTRVRRMHEDLQKRLRASGLGRLAAGVAHEVRNPLAAIKGMAQLVQEGLPDSDPRRKYVGVIEREADRLNRIVEDMLGLAHAPGEECLCDVNALLVQARDVAVHRTEGKQVNVCDETGSIPGIMGNPQRLAQAFLNIFMNALDAAPDGGAVRFRTSLLQERRVIVIEIANTGPALRPEVKEHMFEPFFSTKEKGTGLGLSIAHQAIASHAGAITAESGERETVIRIELPLKDGSE